MSTTHCDCRRLLTILSARPALDRQIIDMNVVTSVEEGGNIFTFVDLSCLLIRLYSKRRGPIFMKFYGWMGYGQAQRMHRGGNGDSILGWEWGCKFTPCQSLAWIRFWDGSGSGPGYIFPFFIH